MVTPALAHMFALCHVCDDGGSTDGCLNIPSLSLTVPHCPTNTLKPGTHRDTRISGPCVADFTHPRTGNASLPMNSRPASKREAPARARVPYGLVAHKALPCGMSSRCESNPGLVHHPEAMSDSLLHPKSCTGAQIAPGTNYLAHHPFKVQIQTMEQGISLSPALLGSRVK